ncbi:MAG: hypothetical protein EXS16_00505 [Gemmataceae bacterium]|nr:hypothetical protein [Gemmataceae bacterium]
MARIRLIAFALFTLGLGVLSARAQNDDLKAVLRKAITAHGGEANLAKLKATVTKYKGTMSLLGGKRDVEGETSLQIPDRLRNVIKIDIQGKEITVITVYNGKQFWVNSNGITTEFTDEKILDEVRQSLLTEAGGNYIDMLKAPYELNAVGEVKIKGKDAVGIRVSKKGQRDISYFFDKKTHLLLKTEMRSYDPQKKQEITQEKYILGYQDKLGLKVGNKAEIYHDGVFFMEVNVTDLQIHAKLDDAVFAKP